MDAYSPQKRQTYGIILIIVSALAFAMMSVFIKLSGDLPTMQKAFFRNSAAGILALFFILKNNENIAVKKDAWPALSLRIICGMVGVLCNFYAVDRLLLSDASMLNKLSPFFAIFFSAIFLKEHAKKSQVIFIIIAFIGSLFVLKPSFDNANLGASIVGMIGGIGAGAAYAAVRATSGKGVSSAVMVFWFSSISTIALVPTFIINFTAMSISQFGFLILTGIAGAVGQFTITAAYSFAPAKNISVYNFSQVLFAAALGLLFFGQLPDLWSVLGYIIVCTVAVLSFKTNKEFNVKQDIL